MFLRSFNKDNELKYFEYCLIKYMVNDLLLKISIQNTLTPVERLFQLDFRH